MSESTCYYYDAEANRCHCYGADLAAIAKAELLKVENAKLRGLVADAWGYINHPANATWTHKKRKEARDSLSDRMCKLGIEVDGVTMARLRSARTAPRVIVADGDTDCATGHCECGGCGGAIDCWDRFCRHCGRRLED